MTIGAEYNKTKSLAPHEALPLADDRWALRSWRHRLRANLSWIIVSLVAMISGQGCSSCYQCPPAWQFPTIPRMGIFRQPLPEPFFEVHKYSLFVAPDFIDKAPRRVLIVPTGTESGRYQVPIHFAESLAGAVRAAGVAEVVFPPQLNCQMSVDRLLTGQFDEWEITSLAKDWQCDGILFVRVNQLQSFDPLKASVTAALVDANESVVVFAIDGNWDTTDPEIRNGFEHFVKQSSLDASHSERRLQLQAPSRLFAFVAQQMTSAWQQALN